MIILLRNAMCFEVMWNTTGTLSNLQEGYRDTTRKWSGHESGPKGWSLLTTRLPDLYTTLTPQPPGNRLLAFKESPSTQEEICCWRDWPKAQRAIVGSERCAQRGKLPPGSVAAVRSRPHLDLCHWSKTPLRFSIVKPPTGKSVPVGFSRKNHRSIILGPSTCEKRSAAVWAEFMSPRVQVAC